VTVIDVPTATVSATLRSLHWTTLESRIGAQDRRSSITTTNFPAT